jgi:DNA-directed RNA polymerase specialized sigma24 family protein
LTESEVDEVLSTAAFNTWRSAHHYDAERGSLAAWFFVVATNAGRAILRQRSRRSLEVAGIDVDRVPGPQEVVPMPPSALVAAVRECISQLPRQQRSIIEADLRAGQVADAGQLARELGTTKNAVYASRSAARKTLREALVARGYAPGEGAMAPWR